MTNDHRLGLLKHQQFILPWPGARSPKSRGHRATLPPEPPGEAQVFPGGRLRPSPLRGDKDSRGWMRAGPQDAIRAWPHLARSVFPQKAPGLRAQTRRPGGCTGDHDGTGPSCPQAQLPPSPQAQLPPSPPMGTGGPSPRIEGLALRTGAASGRSSGRGSGHRASPGRAPPSVRRAGVVWARASHRRGRMCWAVRPWSLGGLRAPAEGRRVGHAGGGSGRGWGHLRAGGVVGPGFPSHGPALGSRSVEAAGASEAPGCGEVGRHGTGHSLVAERGGAQTALRWGQEPLSRGLRSTPGLGAVAPLFSAWSSPAPTLCL